MKNKICQMGNHEVSALWWSKKPDRPSACKDCAMKYKSKSVLTPEMIEGVKKLDIAVLRTRNLKPIAKISDKQRRLNAAYMALRSSYLNAWPLCQINMKECTVTANQIHHPRGRLGKNLLDTTIWLSCCPSCHEWVHNNIELAREMGYIINRLDK